jgi:membrane protein required for colicin V production
LSIVDIVLGCIILMGAYSGYKDGFIVSLFSLVSIILGVLLGFKLMGNIMILLASRYHIDEKILPFVAFGIIFLVIVIVVNLLGSFIKAAIGKSFLGKLDQGTGALLGLLKVTFMLSIMLWIADSLKVRLPAHWTEDSWLHTITANFAPRITTWIGGIIPLFNDVL